MPPKRANKTKASAAPAAAAPLRRSSRSKRIRYTNLYDDSSFESLLEDHERKGEEHRAAKQKSTFRYQHPGYEIPLDSLPALCIERILSYVPDPSDLLNLSRMNSQINSLITAPLVIRAGVFHMLRRKKEAHHRKTLANIMNYLRRRSIHLPSPHRLLRLMNAKQCERGDDCWGKNLCTGKPGGLDEHSTARPFGLAICSQCIKYGTSTVSYRHFSNDTKGVAFYQWNKLMDARVDFLGEKHGPLVRVIELQQIDSSFDNNQDRKMHLESILERAHEGTAHCPLHYEKMAKEYVELFDEAEKEADRRLREEEEMKNMEIAERREEKQSRKVARVRAIFDALEDYLEDCPNKEMALECTWREHDYQECLKFKCTLVDGWMRHMVMAPSSASDKMIRDAASQIKEAFTALDEKNFFSYSFISESSHRYKKGLYEYCTTESSPMAILSSSYADSSFITLVEQNQLTKALIRVFSHHSSTAMARSFALAVVRTNPNAAESQELIENYRSLAARVWKKKSNPYGIMSLATMKEIYNICLEEFKIMKRNARDYLAHDDTASFLRRDSIIQQGDFTRQMALNQVFSPVTNDQYFSSEGRRICAYDALRQKNFTNLRIIHEQYFRRPNQYNLIVNNA